jgi:hypothetical protein
MIFAVLQKNKNIMKKIFALLIAVLFTGVLFAQISCGGKYFTFPNGQKEWSDTLTKTLQSEKMASQNIAPVPLKFRIRLVKKMVMACHYEVEVTNMSTTQTISFSAYNDYTDASNHRILHHLKLKPGQTGSFKIIYSSLGCKVKSEEDCANCGWTFHFQDIKVK